MTARYEELVALRESGLTLVSIGARFGVSHQAIRYALQQSRGIGRAGPKRPWSAEEIAILGSESDEVVARRLSRSVSAVVTKRCHLGIPAFGRYWNAKREKFLGTDTDQAVAEYLGITRSAVMNHRMHLRIPACAPEKRGTLRRGRRRRSVTPRR